MPTINPRARQLAPVAMLLVVVGVLAAMLLGPSQTLAQTRKPGCTTSSAQTRGRHASRQCTRSSCKTSVKTQAHHAAKHHGKHAPAAKPYKRTPKASPPPAAKCEDGSAPVPAQEGGFSCADGSEPACEDGATPTPSASGKSLLCPVPSEPEPGSSEVECGEAGVLDCSGSGAGEQVCEASSGGRSSSVCEGEGEGEEG